MGKADLHIHSATGDGMASVARSRGDGGGQGVSPLSPPKGKADLHIHSATGDGMASVADILDYVEHYTDLDLIAITDHDLIEGAYEARELAERHRYRFQVLVGMEITTLGGHLLALDIDKPIRMLMSLQKTIAAVHEQGGLCVVPHPLCWFTLGMPQLVLNRIVKNNDDEIYLDGIELFNPSVAGRIIHRKVVRLNQTRWHLAECGGSDAHTLSMIGTGHTLFDGHTAADFRRSLRTKTTVAAGRFLTLQDHCQLASIAGQQVFKSWILLPSRHIKRALDSLRRG